MTLAKNNIVLRQDVINKFKSNVVDIVTSGAYSNSNVPQISGQGGTFNAVSQNDLGGINEISNITLSAGIINGTTIYNIMITVMKNCSRVRNFTSNLYFHTSNSNKNIDTNSLETSISGKAVFKPTLPTVPSGYERNKDGGLTVNPSVSNNISGNIGDLNRLNTLCTNMLNAWKSAAANQLIYNYYSCHSSCHSDCHNSRTRR